MFRSFFLSRRWLPWSLLGTALILFATWYRVQLDVQITEWFGSFYDMLQKARGKPASITLDDCFVIRGLKIIEGKEGTFVAMPSRRRKDGEYQDIAHPINNDAREEMERVILDEYKRERERAKVAETPHVSDR